MHKRGYCRYAVSVNPSVTFVSCAKTNKDLRNFFTIGSQAILVFRYQTGWRYSDGNVTGASNAGGVGKKRDSERISLHLHTGLQCCKQYESRSVKNKAATSTRALTAASVVRCSYKDDDEVFVTGSTLYAGDGGQPPSPDTTPLVITPFFAAV